MNGPDVEQLTLFQEDSRANLFPWQETRKGKGMTVTYGRKCSELSENLARVGLLVKMYLESSKLPGEQFVRTWSVRDTLSPYLILKLRLSERRTEGTGCFLWPTARAGGNRNSRNAIIGKSTGGNHKSDMGLEQAVEAVSGVLPRELLAMAELPPRFQQMWPTPRAGKTTNENPDAWMARQAEGKVSTPPLSLAVKMWPTPTRREYKGARTPESLKAAGRTPNNTLGDAVMATNGGQLNPMWVEWLMGFPLGWTDLNA